MDYESAISDTIDGKVVFDSNVQENSRRDKFKLHFIDTTALCAEAAPIFTALELGVSKMSVASSINTRELGILLSYGGLSYLYSKGRDLSREYFRITDDTAERIQRYFDAGYSFAFSLVFSPFIYAVSQYFCGENLDFKKITIGTLVAAAGGIVNGFPAGYAVVVSRDLTGVKECKRSSYPDFLKRQSLKVKKAIFVGLAGVSIGTVCLTYSVAANLEHEKGVYSTFHNAHNIAQCLEHSKPEKSSLEKIVDFCYKK